MTSMTKAVKAAAAEVEAIASALMVSDCDGRVAFLLREDGTTKVDWELVTSMKQEFDGGSREDHAIICAALVAARDR